MKNFILIIAIVFMIDPFSAAKAQEPKSGNKEFVHTVYFWLKNPADPIVRAKFEKSMKTYINSSKYIKTKHIGVPASTNRPVIDSSYSYCLSLTFASKEDQDKYQVEDTHLVFIKESEMLWEKVLVYDSESIL